MASTAKATIDYRKEPAPQDVAAITAILESTGFFYPMEVGVAVELLEDRLTKGSKSDYLFLFADVGSVTKAFCCYGLIPCTFGAYTIYWIAVANDTRGQGIGKALLKETELAVKALGGRAIYLDTAGRPLYESTRFFYNNCGYLEEARLKDFYSPGDDKLIYSKHL